MRTVEPSAAVRAASMGLLLDACAAEVAGAFERAGIDSLLLRGPTLAAWLYDMHVPRPYTDVDLFVPPGDVSRAEAVLAGLGFELLPLPPHDAHARTWVRGDGASVDLHRSLSGADADPERVWSALRRGAQTITVHGRKVAAAGAEALALEVALHVAQHGRQLEHPLEDLRRALAQTEIELWRRAAALAVEIEALPAFASGLRRTDAGAEVADRLALPVHDRAATILRSESPPPLALGIDWLATRPGIAAKTRFLLGKAFPSPAFMRAWSPIRPKRALGLSAAYVLRLFWIIRHAGPALWAWRRARRTASTGR